MSNKRAQVPKTSAKDAEAPPSPYTFRDLDQVYNLFLQFDKNHTGSIPRRELKSAMSQLLQAQRMTRDYMNEKMNEVAKGATEIPFSEFTRLLTNSVVRMSALDLAKKHFETYPRDRFNHISVEEFSARCHDLAVRHEADLAEVQKKLKLLDGDGDGRIGFSEYFMIYSNSVIRPFSEKLHHTDLQTSPTPEKTRLDSDIGSNVKEQHQSGNMIGRLQRDGSKRSSKEYGSSKDSNGGESFFAEPILAARQKKIIEDQCVKVEALVSVNHKLISELASLGWSEDRAREVLDETEVAAAATAITKEVPDPSSQDGLLHTQLRQLICEVEILRKFKLENLERWVLQEKFLAEYGKAVWTELNDTELFPFEGEVCNSCRSLRDQVNSTAHGTMQIRQRTADSKQKSGNDTPTIEFKGLSFENLDMMYSHFLRYDKFNSGAIQRGDVQAILTQLVEQQRISQEFLESQQKELATGLKDVTFSDFVRFLMGSNVRMTALDKIKLIFESYYRDRYNQISLDELSQRCESIVVRHRLAPTEMKKLLSTIDLDKSDDMDGRISFLEVFRIYTSNLFRLYSSELMFTKVQPFHNRANSKESFEYE